MAGPSPPMASSCSWSTSCSRWASHDWTDRHTAVRRRRQLRPRPPAPPPRATPLLALHFRRVLVSPRATRAVAAALAPLFHPAVVVAAAAALLAADAWLLRGASLDAAVADTLRTPPVMLLLLAILLASTLFHEFGHAAACRYGGATPGPIGMALYIIYPAFYTDVTQSYRLGRAGRVRTDLGGVYFNAIFALVLTALYAQTSFAPLLLAIVLVHLELVQQLLPSPASTATSSWPTSSVCQTSSHGWAPSCRASCPAVPPVPGSESSGRPPARW